MRAGSIKNIQAVSSLVGAASTTRTSLIALIFPSSASITKSTINSSLSGYGTFYRETWTDFASYGNKSEFGISGNSGLGASAFDIYRNTTNAGTMKNIVINGKFDNNVSVKSAMASVSNFIGLIPTGSDYNGVNFVRVTDEFDAYSSFVGNFTFNCAYNNTYKTYTTTEKTLEFDIGSVWTNANGITLSFLANV